MFMTPLSHSICMLEDLHRVHRSYANLTEGKIARLRDGSFALVRASNVEQGDETALRRGEESMSHNGRCVQRCSAVTAFARLLHHNISYLHVMQR